MNHHYYVFILTIATTTLTATENEQPSLNNTVNVIQNNTTVNWSEVVTYFTKINWNERLRHAKDNASNTCKSWYGSATGYIQNHKVKTCVYGTTLAYTVTMAHLLYTSLQLDSQSSWANWKYHCTLEELLQVPQNELAQELLLEVQKRYATINDLYDFITPLVEFIKDVDVETAQCKRFLTIHTWIKRFRLQWFFPRHDDLITQAHDKVHRLAYLKNILLSWLSEHKIAMNKPKKRLINLRHKNQISTQRT